jgi:hypothetical protein
MTDKEAMKLALDWFKCYADGSMSRNNAEALADEVVEALKEALAQPEQEPVAWQIETYIAGVWSPMGNPQRNKNRAENLSNNPSIPKENQRIIPLYTHPPQRTEQEPVAHCEAGPEFCPVCRAETRSLALAAAVGYIQRNTPTLVWTEICNALATTPPLRTEENK